MRKKAELWYKANVKLMSSQHWMLSDDQKIRRFILKIKTHLKKFKQHVLFIKVSTFTIYNLFLTRSV